MRKVLPVALLMFVSSFASACKLSPEATDLGAFLSAKKDGQVVFLGKVQSIQDLPSNSSEVKRDITFEASKWWRGSPQSVVPAFGAVGTMAGSDCEGIFDFSAREGEQWLVVGTWWKGKVHPSGLLSVRLQNENLPFEINQLLNQN